MYWHRSAFLKQSAFVPLSPTYFSSLNIAITAFMKERKERDKRCIERVGERKKRKKNRERKRERKEPLLPSMKKFPYRLRAGL